MGHQLLCVINFTRFVFIYGLSLSYSSSHSITLQRIKSQYEMNYGPKVNDTVNDREELAVSTMASAHRLPEGAVASYRQFDLTNTAERQEEYFIK